MEQKQIEQIGLYETETYAQSYSFKWTDNVVCDMNKVSFVRIELRGTGDSYLAFAETKENESKKITFAMGCYSDKKCNAAWIPREDFGNGYNQISRDDSSENPYYYHIKRGCHKGIHNPFWLEVNWNLKGEEG